MKNIITGIIALAIFPIGHHYAQSNNYQLPTVIPPSPAVMNFLRYGEIPVDYSTGVPSISVPLYTVKSRKLELPISISYHAAGIKVDDIASTVGLGWVLNAGGFVAATILSKPDGTNKPTYKTTAAFNRARDSVNNLSNNLQNFRDFGGQVSLELTSYDWQSDRYNFQLPNGESGAFRYDFLTNKLIKAPYSGVKIDAITSNSIVGAGFVITDETGVIYTFNLQALNTYAQTWDLTSIVSADKADTIRFVYKNVANAYTTQSFVSSVDEGGYPTPNGNSTFFVASYQFSNFISSTNNSTERLLDSIISSNSVVKFTVAGDRQDMGVSACPYRITNLTVYDRWSGQQLKSFTFNQSYSGGVQGGYANNKRLMLNGVSVGGSDSKAVENYNFSYNQLELPFRPEEATPDQIPYRFNVDYWGYYNGSQSNSLLPSRFVPMDVSCQCLGPDATIPGFVVGNRDPDHNYASACMLNQINYPTGGKTVFDFEPNFAYGYSIAGVNSYGNVGGFRIRQISNYTSDNTLASYKTYEYDTGITRVIDQDLYGYTRRVFQANSVIPGGRLLITSSPMLPLTADNGPPVFYSKVIEYNGDPGGSVGKTVYNYNVPPPLFHAPFVPPFPDTEGVFNNGDGFVYCDPLELDLGNYIPRLSSKIDYKNVNGKFIPVSETVNTYSSFLSDQYYTGMHVAQLTDYPDGDILDDYHWCLLPGDPARSLLTVGEDGCFDNTYQYPYYLYSIDMHATQLVILPTQTSNYLFSPDGTQSIVSTTNYVYGSIAKYTYGARAHTSPTDQTLVNSTGDLTETRTKYPFDFSSSVVGGSSNVYDQMVSQNIIAPVVQDSILMNNIFLESKTTNYQQWNGASFLPQSIQSLQAGMTAQDTRIVFKNYDSHGNIIELQKANDVVHVYLWGYSGTHPVVEVVGSDYATVSGFVNLSMLNNAGKYTDDQIRTELNKIRTGLAALGKPVLVTTYTYQPLVGITSQTDSNGQITYYQYDTFNRLSYIMDSNLNIVKRYSYNYQMK